MAETAVLKRRRSTISDAILGLMVIGIIGVMIIPVPTPLIDVLLSFNIVFSIIILLVTMYITSPLELTVFPGLLLMATVFRLALNVASTRLILGQAYAGEVINSFGTFVVQGNYVVGFIIFIIIVIIQFIVITKGATRVAEVAARFTLDAMPGKQMAIDADLNAGLIDENEARRRRQEISREADFYGAMDGASKFVRGDVIAGLIITVINIIGGFIIGMVQASHDLDRFYSNILDAHSRRWSCHTDTGAFVIHSFRFACYKSDLGFKPRGRPPCSDFEKAGGYTYCGDHDSHFRFYSRASYQTFPCYSGCDRFLCNYTDASDSRGRETCRR